MNTMIEFDLQFKIFTLVDTTKSYVILNESMNKLLSVSESIVFDEIRAFYKTSFNDPTVKHVCIYFEIAYRQKLQLFYMNNDESQVFIYSFTFSHTCMYNVCLISYCLYKYYINLF